MESLACSSLAVNSCQHGHCKSVNPYFDGEEVKRNGIRFETLNVVEQPELWWR